jgi:hypothetical protein
MSKNYNKSSNTLIGPMSSKLSDTLSNTVFAKTPTKKSNKTNQKKSIILPTKKQIIQQNKQVRKSADILKSGNLIKPQCTKLSNQTERSDNILDITQTAEQIRHQTAEQIRHQTAEQIRHQTDEQSNQPTDNHDDIYIDNEIKDKLNSLLEDSDVEIEFLNDKTSDVESTSNTDKTDDDQEDYKNIIEKDYGPYDINEYQSKYQEEKKNKYKKNKKGPGRPRKTPKKEPIPRKGISKLATANDGFIEVLYDQPIILKKIFQFFKAIAAEQIQVIFRPKEIIMYTQDHHQKSKIRVKIDANKINHYYCKDTIDIGLSSNDLELILNKVDKEYSSILLMSYLASKQRSVDLILDNDMQIDEIHTIDLIIPNYKMENEIEFVDENYTIKFELPSKYFRKTINDIKTMSTELSITQEDINSPLIFEYLTRNKKIQSKHTVKNNEKIKLQSNLSEDSESFRVDIKIDYLKPIASSQIAEEVIILVDENKYLMTKSYIDNKTVEIKTLTEIIDERPEDTDI